jgi:hypothetical protein
VRAGESPPKPGAGTQGLPGQPGIKVIHLTFIYRSAFSADRPGASAEIPPSLKANCCRVTAGAKSAGWTPRVGGGVGGMDAAWWTGSRSAAGERRNRRTGPLRRQGPELGPVGVAGSREPDSAHLAGSGTTMGAGSRSCLPVPWGTSKHTRRVVGWSGGPGTALRHVGGRNGRAWAASGDFAAGGRESGSRGSAWLGGRRNVPEPLR